MTQTIIESAAVIGGCGGFGRAFAGLLKQADIAVTTLDSAPDADVVIDLTAPHLNLAESVAHHDLVLLCVPEHLAILALTSLQRNPPVGVSLVSDICSVKTNICAHAERDTSNFNYASIHPMFGPERGFANQNLVFIPLSQGSIVDAWRNLLCGWDVNVLNADARTHDQVASMVQVLTHATLLSFAQAQAELHVPDELFQAMTTPIFRALDETAQGMLCENPQLYHNIQTANPNGAAARDALQRAVTSVVDALGQEADQATRELFQRLLR